MKIVVQASRLQSVIPACAGMTEGPTARFAGRVALTRSMRSATLPLMSKTSWIPPLLIIAVLTPVISPPAARAALVSEDDIERQADRAFRQMKASIPQSRDADARAYVQCVAQAIVAQLEGPYSDLDWEIVLFEHKAANAFAMPGGKIGVFTGIFRVAPDQDSLATVIGHEVAHVTSQHSLKRARKQVRNNLLVAVAAGAIGGGQRTSNVLSMGAEVGLNLPYDRKQESEADAEGLELMARAGFDPRASITLWKNMSRQQSGQPPEFLSTHPSSDDRIDRMIGQLAPSLMAYNEAHSLAQVPRCE